MGYGKPAKKVKKGAKMMDLGMMQPMMAKAKKKKKK